METGFVYRSDEEQIWANGERDCPPHPPRNRGKGQDHEVQDEFDDTEDDRDLGEQDVDSDATDMGDVVDGVEDVLESS